MKLSPHFSLQELTKSQTAVRWGIDNTPDEGAINNLRRLCVLLEEVREICGNKPLVISSGYRSPEVNRRVGGSITSQHMTGCAADFTVLGLDLDDVIEAIMDAGIEYDQLIKEFDSWIHISVPNIEGNFSRKQALIIDRAGTRGYA